MELCAPRNIIDKIMIETNMTYDMEVEEYWASKKKIVELPLKEYSSDIAEMLNNPPFGQQNTRKDMPVFSGVLKYFPDALKEVSKASKAGNDQHHPDKPLHWDKSKSNDNEDALVRHLIDHSQNPMDDDGVLHLAKVAWRALAALQIFLEKK